MPWRSRLIASTRSSRSAVSEPCWVSTSRSSSSARRLTAPSRSRSRRSRSRLASTSATSGSASSGSSPARFGDLGRLDLEHFADLVRDVGEPALGAFEALLGARGVLARGAHRLERGAGGAVGVRQRVLAFGQPVGGGAALGFRRLDLADQRGASRRRPAARLRGRRARSGLRRRALRASRSARRRRRCASVQASRSAAIAASRRAAISASRASACASARTSARCARCASISPRTAASCASSSSPAPARRARARLPGGRRRLRRGSPSSRALASPSAEAARRRGCISRSASACGRAPRRLRAAARASGRAPRSPPRLRGATSASAAATAFCLVSSSRRTASSSASMSASRFLPARRRAAPVGALAATEKPSQRHRSPSRETSRWPGLSSGARRAASARSITPICARRRASSSAP